MPRFNFRLSDVSTRSDLASKIGVDVKALELVKLSQSTCTTVGCNLHALLKNNGRCLLCQQSWYPRQFNSKGDRLKNCRGHGLYGPQFMYDYEGRPNPSACCCDTPLCEKIGYSHEGMISFPTDPKLIKGTIRVLGLQDEEKKKKIINTPKSYHIAPWHYIDNHLVRGEDGNWKTRTMSRYRDKDGAYHDFCPPNASLETYVNTKMPKNGFAWGDLITHFLVG